jgi:sortase A
MPEEADAAPHGPPVVPEVVAQHDGFACAQGYKARAEPEERGLARSVRSTNQDDLAPLDVEVDTCESGVVAEQRDRGAKVDDGLHDDLPRLLALHETEPGGTFGTVTTMRLARALSAIGRTMITAGLLILLFVVYQLWGTGIYTARAQNRLEGEFQDRLDAVEAESTTTSTTSTSSTSTSLGATTTVTLPPSTAPPLEVVPRQGEAAGRIEIPAIGIDDIFVQGVTVSDLKKGPGHYPDTPFPGQAGNAAIAGHRTTYGAPFNRVDELAPGDEIIITTVQGRFRYQVTAEGRQIVSPNAVEVLNPTEDNRLTLTSCHPKYSARERIVIVAALAGEPAPTIEPPTPATPRPGVIEPEPERRSLDAGLSGEGADNWPVIVWGLVCAAIWLLAWLVGRRWRRWPSYALGLPVFLVALFFFFENFSRLLPANY